MSSPARIAFYRRMQGAARCPIAGPCFECDDPAPHHCQLAAVLRWEPDVAEALELALDAVIYGDGIEKALDRPVAIEKLLGRLCQEHRRLALGFLQRRSDKRARADRRSG